MTPTDLYAGVTLARRTVEALVQSGGSHAARCGIRLDTMFV
jgi:hypothetical protein